MVSAMVLAAGRGERMRPLTDQTPKPLLEVHGTPLIVWQLLGLRAAGFRHIVINHAWLGAQIEAVLGDGKALGLEIHYSPEVQALGTAGGIVNALTLIQGERFVVVSGDIYTDFDYTRLLPRLNPNCPEKAHLVLVDDQRVRQDFDLEGERVIASPSPPLTYGNIGVFCRSIFEPLIAGQNHDLGQLLKPLVSQGEISGERFVGRWDNVGTPADLERVNKEDIIPRH